MDQPPEPHELPRFRAPRSSLAVGRRFRLLAKGPLLGAGVRPRVPAGFRALGRDPLARQEPESQDEKQLVLPTLDNNRSRDLAWAEGRYAADLATEHSLLLAMMMPTETAPDRKKEAQRLHERALKLFTRVDALGPSGVGDARGFASDLRATLQPLLDFEASCRVSQERGTLRSLAWPSLLQHAHKALSDSLDRIDAYAAGDVALDAKAIAATGCQALAEQARLVAHCTDPAERAEVEKAARIATMLEGLASPPGPLDAMAKAFNESLAFHTEACRAVEKGLVRSILHPILADNMRRRAAKLLDDLERSRAFAPPEE